METERADFLVRGAMVYNSYFKKFVPADVSVSGGKFLYIDSRRSGAVEADETVDAEGLYMVPGLIDIHMHIESSMLTPGAFCRRLAECGVTTIVSEPHEMANVNGMQGVLDMIRAGENSPVDIFYGIPSCVPSTSPELETTGGIITCEEMEGLKENPWVACVSKCAFCCLHKKAASFKSLQSSPPPHAECLIPGRLRLKSRGFGTSL